MTTIQSEVVEAFRDIGVPEDKAMKAASALSKRDEDVVSLSRDMTLLKWMMGFVLEHVRFEPSRLNGQVLAETMS